MKKENELQVFKNEELDLKARAIQNEDGSISVNAEDTAIGFGFTQNKKGKIYVRWETINNYIKDLGFDHKFGKDDYIPLELVFKLEYKSKCEKRHEFINLICRSLNIKRPIVEQQQRFELSFIEQLTQTLKPTDVNIEKQKQVFDGKYRVDAYIEEYNLAIEYDETQHFVEPQKMQDIIRQKEIEKELGCKFIRCNYKNTDAYNVGLVMNELIKRMVA